MRLPDLEGNDGEGGADLDETGVVGAGTTATSASTTTSASSSSHVVRGGAGKKRIHGFFALSHGFQHSLRM